MGDDDTASPHTATTSSADSLSDLRMADETYRHVRSNMLLVAREKHLDALLTKVTGQSAASLPAWTPGTPGAAAADCTGEAPETLLVRDVHLLDPMQQRGLFEAIGAWEGRVRVIATSPAPLYPMVSAHRFDEGLYYRLNMLCVEGN